MRRLAAAGAVVVALLSGCSRGGDGPPSAGAAEARELVVQALAWRPEDSAATARFARAVVQEGPGVRNVISRSEGVADYRNRRFRGRQALGDKPAREFFVAGRFQYERPPGGTWDKAPRQGDELDDPVPGVLLGRVRESGVPQYRPSEDDGRAVADALLEDVTPGGTSRQHGTVTRRYRVTLDRARAEQRLDARLADELSAWTANPEDRLEAHLWVDAGGRLRKLRWAVLDSPDHAGALVLEDEWWDYGRPGSVGFPDDLGDPTVTGGEGRTSLTVTGGSVDRLELVDGEERTTIEDVHVGEYTVHVNEGVGEKRYHWSLSFDIPKEGVRPPATVPAHVSRTTSREESTRIVPEHVVPCDRPTTEATVRELVIDSEGRFVRFRATFRLACPSGPPAEGELRLHSLT